MAIRQGTTPTHTFTVPIDTSTLKTVHIAYAQNEQVLFVKRDNDVTLQGDKIITTLTQQDTLMLKPEEVVAIQVRVLTHAGDALTSDTIFKSVEECLEKEVLQ